MFDCLCVACQGIDGRINERTAERIGPKKKKKEKEKEKGGEEERRENGKMSIHIAIVTGNPAQNTKEKEMIGIHLTTITLSTRDPQPLKRGREPLKEEKDEREE